MEMWQRFTHQARRAILIAHDEASRTAPNLIGTEHLLLGLIGLGLGEQGAMAILARLGVESEKLRADIDRGIARATDGPAEGTGPSNEISFTAEAQRVLQLAYGQAREMDDHHIGTEHLLLGLLREPRGTAFRALQKHDATFEAVLHEVATMGAKRSDAQEQEDAGSETMHKQILSSGRIPPAVGPYSQAVQAGNMIFCSGVIGLDPDTKELVQDTFEAEVIRVMENLTMLLEDCGTGLDRVVKTTVFLADMEKFSEFNDIYAQYFDDAPPARSTVQAAALPLGAQIEVEAIAIA